MWILAGPNGSGKTTIARNQRVIELLAGAESLNADEVAAELAKFADGLTDSISLQAAQIVDSAVSGHVKNGKSFSVETVLSSPKYKSVVKEARGAGFQVGLIFVFTRQANLNVLRVKQRVEAGGHVVDPAKVRARWGRSIANLGWFANRADQILLIDNTSGPEFLVEKLPGEACLETAPVQTDAVSASLEKAQNALHTLRKRQRS